LPGHYLKPPTYSYYQIPTGIGGVHFEWAFHGRPRSSFGVELHFEKGSAEFNKSRLAKVEKMKSKIEHETGEKVIFQQEWGKSWSRLYIEKNEVRMTNELKDWAVKVIKNLIDILQPELDSIK